MNSGKVESAKDNLNVETTMAEDSMAFLESLGQLGGEDFLRSLAEREWDRSKSPRHLSL